jgi:hypothetical protein
LKKPDAFKEADVLSHNEKKIGMDKLSSLYTDEEDYLSFSERNYNIDGCSVGSSKKSRTIDSKGIRDQNLIEKVEGNSFNLMCREQKKGESGAENFRT